MSTVGLNEKTGAFIFVSKVFSSGGDFMSLKIRERVQANDIVLDV